jgi:hypothetical protein
LALVTPRTDLASFTLCGRLGEAKPRSGQSEVGRCPRGRETPPRRDTGCRPCTDLPLPAGLLNRRINRQAKRLAKRQARGCTGGPRPIAKTAGLTTASTAALLWRRRGRCGEAHRTRASTILCEHGRTRGMSCPAPGMIGNLGNTLRQGIAKAITAELSPGRRQLTLRRPSAHSRSTP